LRQGEGLFPVVAYHPLAIDQHNVGLLQARPMALGSPVHIGFHRVPKTETMPLAMSPDLLDDDVGTVMIEGRRVVEQYYLWAGHLSLLSFFPSWRCKKAAFVTRSATLGIE
jgi:hypothetical protein